MSRKSTEKSFWKSLFSSSSSRRRNDGRKLRSSQEPSSAGQPLGSSIESASSGQKTTSLAILNPDAGAGTLACANNMAMALLENAGIDHHPPLTVYAVNDSEGARSVGDNLGREGPMELHNSSPGYNSGLVSSTYNEASSLSSPTEHFPPSYPTVHQADGPLADSNLGSATQPSISLFNNASHFHVGNLNLNLIYHEASSLAKADKGWELLVGKTAPNALYNSDSRFDPPKCDEDTRKEVIKELKDWIEDRKSPQRLLCMTGAAGAGKSALQQTISEACAWDKILAATFFFSVTDPSRKDVSPLVPTIAYQLGMENESLRGFIGAAVAKDPLIFSKSLHTQMDTLLINPVEILRVKDPPQFKALPFAILIDGLDECSGEDRQAELLSAIKRCFLDRPNVPFRLFLASRPELAIRSALQPGGYLHEVTYHLQLSDNYDATADIRRYLWRRLREAGARSSDPRARFQSWPRESDINALVCAALGQFIYAATVIKYVLDPRSSPYDRLANAVKWASGDRPKSSNPFSSIDLLYRNILKNAKDAYDAVDTNNHDFMLIVRSYQLISMPTEARSLALPKFNFLLDLEEGAHDLILTDLQSLVTTYLDNPPKEYGFQQLGLRFYHRSFVEYMGDESRSQNFYVSTHRVWGNLMSLCMDRAFRDPVETIPCCKSDCCTFGNECLRLQILICWPWAIFIFELLLERVTLDDFMCERLSSFTAKGGWELLEKWNFAWERHGPRLPIHAPCRIGVWAETIAEHLKDTDPLTAARINERVDRWNKEPPVQGISDIGLLQEFKSVWSKKNPGRLFEELEQPDPEIPVYDRFISFRL